VTGILAALHSVQDATHSCSGVSRPLTRTRADTGNNQWIRMNDPPMCRHAGAVRTTVAPHGCQQQRDPELADDSHEPRCLPMPSHALHEEPRECEARCDVGGAKDSHKLPRWPPRASLAANSLKSYRQPSAENSGKGKWAASKPIVASFLRNFAKIGVLGWVTGFEPATS
jgi:hypothetical protein